MALGPRENVMSWSVLGYLAFTHGLDSWMSRANRALVAHRRRLVRRIQRRVSAIGSILRQIPAGRSAPGGGLALAGRGLPPCLT